MKEKQIQIPESLFKLIGAIALDESQRTEQNFQLLEKGIMDKLNRQIAHDYYTRFKKAPTEEESEKARQDYLNFKGIPENFRY